MAWLGNRNSNVTSESDMHFTTEFQRSSSVDSHSTRKIVKSNCRTEEVEPGRFVRKCEKTVEVLKDCLGKNMEKFVEYPSHRPPSLTPPAVHQVHSSFWLFRVDPDYYYCGMDEDLWTEILKRLPIKTLSRLLSVCKGWNSLISSAFFIKLHYLFLTRSTTPCNLKPYLHVTSRYFKSLRQHWYALISPQNPRQRLHCPFHAEKFTDHQTLTVDVIHGVVCISYYKPASPSLNPVLLWNPSIQKYVALPCLSLSLARHFKAIGFGYDASKNDFKVVLFPDTVGGVVTYQVYSALQGFWRPPVKTNIFENLIFGTNDHNCCFVNGTIHWLLDVSYRPDSGSDSIVVKYSSLLMFDCELEVLTTIDIPQKLFWSSSAIHDIPLQVKLLEYAGMLAILVEHVASPASIDMWVMKEHGVSSSWKKLYTIKENGRYNWCVTLCDPSFEDPTPYGPNNQPWIKCRHFEGEPFQHIMSDHVYEESMFLMDHPNVQSYIEIRRSISNKRKERQIS